MLPVIFIPSGPSPSGDCKPTGEKADGALSLLFSSLSSFQSLEAARSYTLKTMASEMGTEAVKSVFPLSDHIFHSQNFPSVLFFFLTTCLVSPQCPTFVYVVHSFILLKNLNTYF